MIMIRYQFFTKSLMDAVAKVIRANYPRVRVTLHGRTSEITTNLKPRDMAQIMGFPYEVVPDDDDDD